MTKEPKNKETTEQVKEVANPTGKGGFGDNPQNINPGGRPKNSLKGYVAKKLAEMSDTEKDEFLNQLSPDLQWRMAEGQPHQTQDLTSDGDPIVPLFDYVKNRNNNGDKQDSPNEEEN